MAIAVVLALLWIKLNGAGKNLFSLLGDRVAQRLPEGVKAEFGRKNVGLTAELGRRVAIGIRDKCKPVKR